ncbi:hypothetical protein ACTHHL_11195 [Aeribacillus composti]|nr:hypothetical protein APP_07970 [Aeribacillus pallidus]
MNNKLLFVIIMSLPKTFVENNCEQRYFVTFKKEVVTDYIREKGGKIIL